MYSLNSDKSRIVTSQPSGFLKKKCVGGNNSVSFAFQNNF